MVMLGWRLVNSASNCFWRSKKVASQACATLSSTAEVGSATELLGQAASAPSDSSYRLVAGGAAVGASAAGAGAAAVGAAPAGAAAGGVVVPPQAASSAPMLV